MTMQVMDLNELEQINGGSPQDAKGVLIIGGAVLMVVGAPVAAAFAGTAALVAFGTAMLTGIGLMGQGILLK